MSRPLYRGRAYVLVSNQSQGKVTIHDNSTYTGISDSTVGGPLQQTAEPRITEKTVIISFIVYIPHKPLHRKSAEFPISDAAC